MRQIKDMIDFLAMAPAIIGAALFAGALFGLGWEYIAHALAGMLSR